MLHGTHGGQLWKLYSFSPTPTSQQQRASIRRPNFYCSASRATSKRDASITPDPERKLNLTLQLGRGDQKKERWKVDSELFSFKLWERSRLICVVDACGGLGTSCLFTFSIISRARESFVRKGEADCESIHHQETMDSEECSCTLKCLRKRTVFEVLVMRAHTHKM